MRIHLLSIMFLFLSINLSFAQENQDKKELQKQIHAFDFWIGEWNVYKVGTDTLVGKSKIESILDSMAIRETYHSTRSNYKGTSLNKYNQRTGRWEQFWVANGGGTLYLQGNLEGDKMVLDDIEQKKEGEQLNRITWIPQKDGTVHQIWDISKDNGKTWKTGFYGVYKKE